MTRAFVLTYCRHLESIDEATLVFKTLRTGFPDAEIHVVDNCSLDAARGSIRDLAHENDCRFSQFNKTVAHHSFIEYILREFAGPLVFLDPDLIFWAKCQDWQFDGLLAGRLIPKFRDELSGTITLARLHTSLLWVTDSARLREAIEAIKRRYWDFQPFLPVTFKANGQWFRYDCGASLYAAMPADFQAFREKELSSYDHLFLGSHRDLLVPHMNSEDAQRLKAVFAQARSDFTQLRGLWKLQDQYFERRRVESD